jgi:hypothetical protein
VVVWQIRHVSARIMQRLAQCNVLECMWQNYVTEHVIQSSAPRPLAGGMFILIFEDRH